MATSVLFVFVTSVLLVSGVTADEILAKDMNFKLHSGDLMPLVGCKYFYNF